MTRCQNCKSSEATVTITQRIGYANLASRLCGRCYIKSGIAVSDFDSVIITDEGWNELVKYTYRVPGLADLLFNSSVSTEEILSERIEALDKPPSRAEFILQLFLPMADRRAMIGDLAEEYCDYVVPKYGCKKAKLWYWTQVVKSFIPSLWMRFLKIAAIGWLLKFTNALIKKLV